MVIDYALDDKERQLPPPPQLASISSRLALLFAIICTPLHKYLKKNMFFSNAFATPHICFLEALGNGSTLLVLDEQSIADFGFTSSCVFVFGIICRRASL